MRIYAKSAKTAQHEETIASLKSGGVGVMPTDTIYGLVGQALKPKTVERIYRLKKTSQRCPVYNYHQRYRGSKTFRH